MKGDDDFRDVFHEHSHAVYDFCWRLTNSISEAEDITQDVFLAFWRRRQSHTDPIREIRSFLLGTARNIALKRWRDRKRWSVLEEDHFVAQPLEVEHLDAARAVALAVASLPPLQREVLILSAYEELSIQEISNVTNAAATAVKARLHRARESMKRLLAGMKVRV